MTDQQTELSETEIAFHGLVGALRKAAGVMAEGEPLTPLQVCAALIGAGVGAMNELVGTERTAVFLRVSADGADKLLREAMREAAH